MTPNWDLKARWEMEFDVREYVEECKAQKRGILEINKFFKKLLGIPKWVSSEILRGPISKLTDLELVYADRFVAHVKRP